MTVLDRDYFEVPAGPSALRTWLARWPIVVSLFIAVVFMLATNDLSAGSRWQEAGKDPASQLQIVSEGNGRLVRQVAFILLGVWGVASLLWPSRRIRALPAILFPLLILVGWIFASVLWSGDRAFTSKRLVVFACFAIGVFAFARRTRARDLATMMFVGCAVQMIADVVADLLWATGKYGLSGYRLSGLQHPNHAGSNAVFFCFACLYFYDRTRLRRFIVLFAASAVVLFLTKSRSSLVAGCSGMFMFALLRWPARKVFAGALLVAIALAGFGLLDAMGAIPEEWSKVIYLGREDAQSGALTGRPMIWAAAFEQFGHDNVRYLTGFGYDSFWTPERASFVSNRLRYGISEGHDAYFDMLLSLGIVGVACYAFVLLGSLGRAAVLAFLDGRRDAALFAMILTFAVVHGITESTTVAPTFPTFFSCAAIAYIAIRTPERKAETAIQTDREWQ
jgi:exopolysaccharide production protein ExoQ